MTNNVVKLERIPGPVIKSCQTCKFRNNDDVFPKDPYFWHCGISGYFCKVESVAVHTGCGPKKLLWQQRPPDPPSFLKRLGDAIIERVRGNRNAQSDDMPG